MASPLLRCYACSSVIPHGVEECPGCGAEQSLQAQEKFLDEARTRKQINTWKTAAICLALVALLALGYASASSGGGGATVPEDQPAPGTVASRVDFPEATDAYIRVINKHFASQGASFEILGWSADENGTIFMELRPPTENAPLVLWQVIDAKARQNIMTFLSVTHAKVVLSTGTLPPGATGPFPQIILQYKGSAAPLAVRKTSGEVAVFPSPLDSLYAPLMRQMEGQANDQSGTPTR